LAKGPRGTAPSSRRARRAGLDIRAAMSGSEDFIVWEDSGDLVRDLRSGEDCSAGGVGAGKVKGREVNASGAEMADMTPPKAE